MSGIGVEQSIGEILISSREALGVSRARCYSMDANGLYRLSASYGFAMRSAPPSTLESGHPLIEWAQRHRKPAFANGFRDAGVLAALMEKERYGRSLVAPVYLGSRLAGILELQDKLGNALFGPEDLHQVTRVTDRIGAVLGNVEGVALSPEPLPTEDQEALFLHTEGDRAIDFPPPPELFSPAPAVPTASARERSADAATLDTLRREHVLFKAFESAVLLSPDVEAVVFSLWGRDAAQLSVGARRPLSEAARAALDRNLESALRSPVSSLSLPKDRSVETEYPIGRGPGEVGEPAGIQTSVVFAEKSTLLFTLLFSRPPSGGTEAAFKELHRLVRASVLQLRRGSRYHVAYRSLVHAILEPGRKNYPQLKAHSLAVGALTRRFAAVLRLSGEEIEQLTVAALLHDIGLRELEIPYEKLGGRRPLDLQEVTIVREHAGVGSSLLERIDFPYPVAKLVRHHHERYDGMGYPDRLAGNKIPFGARVIAIADAYDAMTSPHSYRAPVSRESALDTLSGKGGTQFDPELARRFCELVRATAVVEEGELLPEIGP
ncbi:MAG TPA: HD domain-containing phosphohydrolase [Thermoanaerobaculia bacterium]